MGRPKKQIEVHGKVESPDLKPTTLEQVWGYNEMSRYGTKSESEYEQSLLGMNRPELESQARKMGVVVVENSERIRGKLIAEFRQHFASLQKPVNPPAYPQKISDEVRKILAEGR